MRVPGKIVRTVAAKNQANLAARFWGDKRQDVYTLIGLAGGECGENGAPEPGGNESALSFLPGGVDDAFVGQKKKLVEGDIGHGEWCGGLEALGQRTGLLQHDSRLSHDKLTLYREGDAATGASKVTALG